MDFLKKLGVFFGFQQSVPPAPLPPPKLTLPEESLELMKKIENQRLDEINLKLDNLNENMILMTKNMFNLIRAYKIVEEKLNGSEETMIAMMTIHEEILNQFEQGKIMVVKPQMAPQPKPEENILGKGKKKDDEWN